MNDESIRRIRLLSGYLVVNTTKLWEGFWCEDTSAELVLETFEEALTGIKSLLFSLSLDFDLTEMWSHFDYQKPISSLMGCFWATEQLNIQIKQSYGSEAGINFNIVLMLIMAVTIADVMSNTSQLEDVPTERQELVLNEKENGQLFLKTFGESLKETDNSKFFGNHLGKRFEKLKKILLSPNPSKIELQAIYKQGGEIANLLIPGYDELSERLERAKLLLTRLQNCKTGHKYFREYEQVCIDILRYLFVPPFKNVVIQARSEFGKERRDAILPNNQYGGFWRLIRDEFQSRHIVCEFKNYCKDVSKDQLNQLRCI